MKIQFYAPHWGSESLDYDQFFAKVKESQFHGVEMMLPFDEEKVAKIEDGLRRYQLEIIGHVGGPLAGETLEESLANYRRLVEQACRLNPRLANLQSGRDYYSFEQNKMFIDAASEISDRAGVKAVHETHRSKFSFAAHVTQDYLQRIPELRITADFSHWCCVAETLLEDQQDAVDLAISRADHIHARVGFAQGPQVTDLQNGIFAQELNAHLNWWDKIVAQKREVAAEMLTITCEFGPVPYMPVDPKYGKPITSQWELNCRMCELLTKRYRVA